MMYLPLPQNLTRIHFFVEPTIRARVPFFRTAIRLFAQNTSQSNEEVMKILLASRT